MTEAQRPEALRLLQEYRKTMPSEVLHLWANDACYTMYRQQARIAELERWQEDVRSNSPLLAELQRANARVQELEASESRTIAQRDHCEEVIDRMADAVLGKDRHEWTSNYDYMDAAQEVEDRIAELESQLEAIGAGGVEPLRKPAAAQQAEPFMWAIQEPGGGAYMDVGCVSSVREDVQAEVDGLNSGLDADDDPYQVVPVYLAAAPQAVQAAVPVALVEAVNTLDRFMQRDSYEITQTESDAIGALLAEAKRLHPAPAHPAAGVAHAAATQPAAQGMEQDAKRYRWLRECNSGSLVVVEITGTGDEDWHVLTEADADAAIDAALAAQAKQGG